MENASVHSDITEISNSNEVAAATTDAITITTTATDNTNNFIIDTDLSNTTTSLEIQNTVVVPVKRGPKPKTKK